MLKKLLRRIAAAALFTAVAGGASAQNAPPPRLAWVVGETAYVGDMLPTSSNDAALIAKTLAGDGFDVTESHDLDTPNLAAAYRAFLAKVQATPPGAAVTIYLAGLGVTVGCDDFLLPIDAQIRSASDVAPISLSMTRVMNDIAATGAQVRVVVLDGSRPVPPSVSSVAFPKGLIPLGAPPATAFAMGAEIHDFELQPKAGDVNDVYAPALASALQQPLPDIESTLKAARLAAHQSSGGAQTPWLTVGANMPAFAYLPTATPDQAQQALAALPAAPGPLASMAADGAYWAAIWRNSLGDYQAFLAAFSTSATADEVSRAQALVALLSMPNPTCQSGPAPVIQPVMPAAQPVYEGPAIYEGPICPDGFEPSFVNGVDYCSPIQVGSACPFGAVPVVIDGVAYCRIVSVCPNGQHPHWNGHGWSCGEPCHWGEMGCPCPPDDPRCHRPPDCRPGRPDCAPIGCPPGLRFIDGACRPFGGGNGPACRPGEVREANGACGPANHPQLPGPTGGACPFGEMRVNNGPCAPANHAQPPGAQNAQCPGGEVRNASGACMPTTQNLPQGNKGACPAGETRLPSGACAPPHLTTPPVVHAPPPPVFHAPPPPVVHAPPPPVFHAPPPPVVHAPPPPVFHAPPPPPHPVAMPPQSHSNPQPQARKCGHPNEPKC